MKKKILIWGMVGGLIFSVMPIKVQALSEVISYIYHKHQGTAEEQGGCFQKPVYHTHKGDSRSGGECYGQMIYHRHEGSETAEGGCFTVPAYHIHQGSQEAAGGCYVEQYHQHNQQCYTSINCEMKIDSFVYCFDTWYETCHHHGKTVHGNWDIILSHSACGQGKVPSTASVCNSCRYAGAMGSHSTSRLHCSREKEVTGYALGCGMDESTITGYHAGCGMTEGETVTAYDLSCKQTEKSVERYDLGCGWEETVPLGWMKITNLTDGTAEEAVLEASYRDNSGKDGGLWKGDVLFVWKETASGGVIGEGNRLTVRANGSYTATLQTGEREHLSATMQVNHIKKPDGGGSNGNGGSNGSGGNNGNGGNSGKGVDDHSTGEDSKEGLSDNDVINEKPETEKTNPADSANRQASASLVKKKESILQTMPPLITPRPDIQTPSPGKGILIEETEEKEAWEAESAAEKITVQEVSPAPSFLSHPVAKAFVITLGGFLALLAGAGVWFFLFRYVGIYGDDGEGNDCFLGFGLLRKEEGFLLLLPEHIVDRACTSRYCLRPGILFYKIHEQSEMMIEIKEKKRSLPIEKEMRFQY